MQLNGLVESYDDLENATVSAKLGMWHIFVCSHNRLLSYICLLSYNRSFFHVIMQLNALVES